ncbi:MAG TPA: DUF6468 domain-containing protein [Methylomirabilota bacterium]|nr:DUF6468 domain-containing protein [Methylomirabilota bacterium]
MTDINLGMAIEVVVAGLLVTTIAYCMVLNRRLTRLRADEEVLRATIAELITATEIAERAILGLKATASECEKSLGARLLKAESMSVDLDRQVAAGGEIVRRIGAIVGASTARETARVADEPAPAAPAAQPAPPQQEPLSRSLQQAAERLAAYRRGPREAAA